MCGVKGAGNACEMAIHDKASAVCLEGAVGHRVHRERRNSRSTGSGSHVS